MHYLVRLSSDSLFTIDHNFCGWVGGWCQYYHLLLKVLWHSVLINFCTLENQNPEYEIFSSRRIIVGVLIASKLFNVDMCSSIHFSNLCLHMHACVCVCVCVCVCMFTHVLHVGCPKPSIWWRLWLHGRLWWKRLLWRRIWASEWRSSACFVLWEKTHHASVRVDQYLLVIFLSSFCVCVSCWYWLGCCEQGVVFFFLCWCTFHVCRLCHWCYGIVALV